MSRIDRLRKQNQESAVAAKEHLQELDKMSAEADRVADVAKDVHIIVGDLDRQFEKATGLKWQDVKFLFFATALQCVRQYVLTRFTLLADRPTDKAAAKNTFGHTEEHSNRHHRYYHPSLDEIKSNPVPFDAIRGSARYEGLKGGGHYGHRGSTLGHDPILGIVFGTANIATATLTNNRFESFHITTSNSVDAFKNRASTTLVVSKTAERLLEEPEAVAYSLLKEIVHLNSDVNSRKSLPLPVISVVNPQLVSILGKYGLDMANVITIGKQALYASMINAFISMLHGLCYDESMDKDNRSLYTVKTKKVIMYSNTIATCSNILVTALQVYSGDVAGAVENFDVGGLVITLYRLINDGKFIKEIKQEFLANEFYNIVMG